MFLIEITVGIFFLYACLILSLYWGWQKIKSRHPKCKSFPSVSIIIAFKDEVSNLECLITSLSRLDYPKEKLEFIFSNDHSSDGSLELLEKIQVNLQGKVQIVSNPESRIGKKAALKTAALVASGDILFFTDADCSSNPGWIKSTVNEFENPEIKMVQGPVLITENHTSISRLQQIEFLSLMMTAAGSTGINQNLIASGANLSVRRSVYLDSLDSLKSSIHTGDDMFLLEYVKRKFKKGIYFNKSTDANISTPAVNNLNKLWNQRKRWTSKAVNYTDWQIISTSILVFLTNLSILGLYVMPISDIKFLYWAVGLHVLKTLADLPLMLSGIRFYQIKHGTKWFLLTQLFYPIYVTTVAFAGVFGKFSWKDRKDL